MTCEKTKLYKRVAREAQNGFDRCRMAAEKEDYATAAAIGVATLEKISRWLRAGVVGGEDILSNITE